MTRASIDVGIDLGTTNSAIAVIQRGNPFVIPDGNRTTMPSAVRIMKSGTVMIGQKAYDRIGNDPRNAVGEFKRWIGTGEVMRFQDAGTEMTATQLSAEVLKVLKGNGERYLGEPIRAAVITVPAAFDLTQCAATQEAAAMAGIEHAPLLQEPIAASLAYGYRLDMEGQNWLVYDMGGGTFDLALVGVHDGRIQVLDHEGDNHLGGKDLDHDLLQHILLPKLAREYSIDSLVSIDPHRRTELAKLKALAEEIKIELSTKDVARSYLESSAQNPIIDDSGDEIEAEFEVTRSEFESVIRSRIARTIRLSRTLLDRNQSVDVEAVLMVGGPTLIPLVRQMVEGDLGISVQTAADPMTVVAEGAASYAATIPRRREHRQFVKQASDVRLDLVYNSVTNDDSMLIGGNVPDPILGIEILAGDGSWSSGQIPVTDGRFRARIPLPVTGIHNFELRAFESNGNSVSIDPDSITVTRGLAAAAAPLSKSLGVILTARNSEDLTVEQLIYKGSPLPARAVREYRTTIPLEPGSNSEVLRIYAIEGESNIPNRNRKVAEVTITGSGIERRVPAGNPIEVSIEVDESRLLSVSAYLPILDRSFNAEVSMGYEDVSPSDLARDVTIERQRVHSLAERVPAAASREINEQLREVVDDVQLAETGDQDATQRALRKLQEVQERVDSIEATQRFPMAVASARETSEATAEVILDVGEDDDRARLRALNDELEAAIEERDLPEIRSVEERMDRLRFEVIGRHPGFWVGFFYHLVEQQPDWTNPVAAGFLINQGQQQIAAEDVHGLRATIRDLYDLVPPDEASILAQFSNVGIQR